MNAIASHKDALEKLLVDLSSDRVVSAITFEALVDAYITRLDTNCSDLNACIAPPPTHRDSGLTYGINIDSKLRALLQAAQTFDITQQIKQEDGVKEIESDSRSPGQKRSAPGNFRGKPKYLFRGMVK